MAESALAKLNKARAEKAMAYKTTHDVERVHHLIAATSLMRDWSATSALAASLTRELAALSLKQTELDAKEKEEAEKAYREALAADNKASEPEENKASEEVENARPTAAPSVPRRTF